MGKRIQNPSSAILKRPRLSGVPKRGIVRKPKTFVLVDPIYSFKWCIFVGGKLNEAISYFAKQLDVAVWEHPYEPGAQFFTYRGKRAGGMWFQFKPRCYPGLVAHECYHAVQYLADSLQTKQKENTEEIFAYYLQWLVEEILLGS